VEVRDVHVFAADDDRDNPSTRARGSACRVVRIADGRIDRES
jgi:hypothetical protein